MDIECTGRCGAELNPSGLPWGVSVNLVGCDEEHNRHVVEEVGGPRVWETTPVNGDPFVLMAVTP